ncbi:MAG: TauD/TfdA family dioxygenase [Proteobacteria bacterium]|nr:TauD/TfdA family dioxygenase [Pseudomonadota bacterium]
MAEIQKAEIRALDNGFGREVVGIDASSRLDDETLAWIEQAFAGHPVLVFRQQRFDAPALDAFARRFGTPQRHVMLKYRHPEIPEVSYVRNVDDAGKTDPFGVKRASNWHADATYEAHLPRLAMLHALEVPSTGGGTLFADMRAAFDGLEPDLKETLIGLTGVHGFNVGPGAEKLYATQKLAVEQVDQFHPAVLRHPYSGRPILFVNPSHTYRFAGMEAGAGWALVERLSEHAIEPRFLYHHHWRPGDLVIWDELATMHRNAADADPKERRVLLRSIVYPAAGAPKPIAAV